MAASLAMHVGVVGLALGRSNDAAAPALHLVDIELLPASAGPSVEPPPVPAPSDRTPIAPLRSPLLVRRARPAAAGHLANTALATTHVAPAGDAVPHFNVSTPSVQDEAPAHFVLPIASAPVSTARVDVAGQASARDEQTLAASEVSVPARLIASLPTIYPAAARAAEVEAEVPLEIVVDARGQVIEARPLTAAGYGLEQAALQAVRAYRFSAAQRLGRPVRVRMRWVVRFQLR